MTVASNQRSANGEYGYHSPFWPLLIFHLRRMNLVLVRAHVQSANAYNTSRYLVSFWGRAAASQLCFWKPCDIPGPAMGSVVQKHCLFEGSREICKIRGKEANVPKFLAYGSQKRKAFTSFVAFGTECLCYWKCPLFLWLSSIHMCSSLWGAACLSSKTKSIGGRIKQ